MAEFLLEKNDSDPATYKVHDIHCTAVTEPGSQRYLGSYANALAAFNKAIGLHSGVDYCPACIKS